MIRVSFFFFFPADLKEVRHKGPKGYRDYGTSHCQSSPSIPLPDAVPHHQGSILVSCGKQEPPSYRCLPALIKTHTINTTVNFYTVFKKALYKARQLLVCWCSAWGTKAGMGEGLVWGPTGGIKGTTLKWLSSNIMSCESGSDTQTSSFSYRLDPIACWQTQCLALMAKEIQEE